MPGFEKTPTNENIPIVQFPRVYDMNSPVPVKEYIDAHTGVRLIVKGDALGTYTYELSWDEGDESYNQEINEAMRRLMTSAGLLHNEKSEESTSMEVYDPTSGQTIQAKRGIDGLPIVEQ